jgi:hypothetical protein
VACERRAATHISPAASRKSYRASSRRYGPPQPLGRVLAQRSGVEAHEAEVLDFGEDLVVSEINSIDGSSVPEGGFRSLDLLTAPHFSLTKTRNPPKEGCPCLSELDNVNS